MPMVDTPASETTRAAELAAEIRAWCAEHQDPAQARRYTRFFREGYDAWGLDKDSPFWTTRKQEWLERYRDLGLRGFFAAGGILLESGKHEEGAMAICFAVAFQDQMDASAEPLLAEYFRAGIRNWAQTDFFAGKVLDSLVASGRLPFEALAGWRASDLKYQRRAVPVALISLLSPAVPVSPLLDFIRPMMLDSERVVHQGLGWFLREAWKRRPKEVEQFLREWKDSAPRLIFQYATEKMTPAGRARYRRVRKAV
jgi:hypothetical protein